MSQSNYHHGNLKNALIEAGIEIVHIEGMQQLSLRKVATRCGVSHAAPYKHFKDKESLLDAMKSHITKQFSSLLCDIANKHQNESDIMHRLGNTYLRFFIENPHYYHFLFGQIGVQINLEKDEAENYLPFNLFRTSAIAMQKKMKISEEYFTHNIIAMWSIVHGITAMAIMDTVSYTGDWFNLLDEIMRDNFSFSGLDRHL